MEWGSVGLGAFLGIALTVGLLALAVYPLVRRSFLLWAALRALCFAIMSVALFPVALTSPTLGGEFRADIGEIALSIAIGSTGPFLAAYIEDRPRFARIRYWLRTLFIVGVLGAIATALAPLWSGFDLIHDLLLLTMILGMTAGLTAAVRSGSRFAQYQAVGYAPLIILGLLVLAYELSTGAPVPYWPVAALLAVLVDFMVTAGGVINGYLTVKRERDEAWADVSEARIAVATDPLTEIANRRGLALRFRDPAHPRPAALAVIDCDHFKRINDMFGHDTGDEVLIAVAEGLKQENVFPARQGGEEFVVLIYGEDYQRLAETVRRQITLSVLEKVPEVPFPVTASAGLTEVRPNDTLDSAVKRGDEALYAAKDAGRDQLLLWQDGKHSQPRLVHGV
jgi:diguanylate cyclase (GGDEF)-like protein